MEKRTEKRKIKTEKKQVKYRIKTEILKKWGIIFLVILALSSALVLLIFKDSIFDNNVLGEVFNITELPEYKENVKKSKVERIAILSQTTNYITEEKEDIKRIMEFVENIEGSVDKSEVSSMVSNTYGIVLYYKDDTNTVITISPNKFAVADSNYYKNEHAYYTSLQKLLEELK